MKKTQKPKTPKTIKEIKNLDIDTWMRFDKKQMAQIIKKIAPSINKKLPQLKKYNTPAYRGMMESGGEIKINPNARLSTLRKDFKRAVTFLNAKTNTVSAFKNLQKKLYGDRAGKLSDKEKSDIWDLYRKIEEEGVNAFKEYGSDKALKQIVQNYGKMSIDEIREMLLHEIEEDYLNKEIKKMWNDVSEDFKTTEEKWDDIPDEIKNPGW